MLAVRKEGRSRGRERGQESEGVEIGEGLFQWFYGDGWDGCPLRVFFVT